MFKIIFQPNIDKLSKVGYGIAKLSTSNFFHIHYQQTRSGQKKDTTESPRLREFRKKLRERTPIESLQEFEEGQHPYQEKEPLKPFPDNTNPETGEVGGPRGPEPTRYGDWERKGRVTDF